jgi:pimeloyl-ACP methyl ester carboxylesterase
VLADADGSHDLHYIPTMPEAIEKVRAASTEPVRMLYVRNADHHLYVDNPVDFHREVAAALA